MRFYSRPESVILSLIFASLILPGTAAGYTCQSESAQYSAPNACGGCPQANLPPGSFVEHKIIEPLFGDQALGATCVGADARTGIGAIGDGCADDYCAFQSAARHISNCHQEHAVLLTVPFPQGGGTCQAAEEVYRIGARRVVHSLAPGFDNNVNCVEHIRYHDVGMGSKCNNDPAIDCGLKIAGEPHRVTGAKPKLDVRGDFLTNLYHDATQGLCLQEPWVRSQDSVIPFMFQNSRNFVIAALEIDGNVDEMRRVRASDPNTRACEGTGFGIWTANSHDYSIWDVHSHHWNTDGIYIGGDYLYRPDTGVLVQSSQVDHNSRNGISIIQAVGVDVPDSEIRHNGFTGATGCTNTLFAPGTCDNPNYGHAHPGYGLFVEANRSPDDPWPDPSNPNIPPFERTRDITIDGSLFDSNRRGELGVAAQARNVGGVDFARYVENVQVRNSTFWHDFHNDVPVGHFDREDKIIQFNADNSSFEHNEVSTGPCDPTTALNDCDDYHIQLSHPVFCPPFPACNQPANSYFASDLRFLDNLVWTEGPGLVVPRCRCYNNTGSDVLAERNKFIALHGEPLNPQPPAYDPEDLPPDIHCALGSFFPCVDLPTARFVDNTVVASPTLFPASRLADGFHPLTLLNVQESSCNSFESAPFQAGEFFTVNYGNTNPIFADDRFPICDFRASDTAACPDLSCSP